MPQLPLWTKFYTTVPYNNVLDMGKFGGTKIQNGRQVAVFVPE